MLSCHKCWFGVFFLTLTGIYNRHWQKRAVGCLLKSFKSHLPNISFERHLLGSEIISPFQDSRREGGGATAAHKALPSTPVRLSSCLRFLSMGFDISLLASFQLREKKDHYRRYFQHPTVPSAGKIPPPPGREHLPVETGAVSAGKLGAERQRKGPLQQLL